MHDAHDHFEIDPGYALSEPKWVVYLESQDGSGYWTCSVVESYSDMDAIEKMMQVMPVKSPFRAWAFPIEESEGTLLTASVSVREVE